MIKVFLLSFSLVLSTFLFAQAPVSTASIFFETDRSELSVEARQTLDALAPALLKAPDYQVNIEAFADDRGTVQYNLRLAADRAASVLTDGLQHVKNTVTGSITWFATLPLHLIHRSQKQHV